MFKFQGQYGLSLIAESDVDITVENLDQNKSTITLRVTTTEDELAEWVPRSTNNPDWKDKDKFFERVHVVLFLLTVVFIKA